MNEAPQFRFWDRTWERIGRAFRDVAKSARTAWGGTYHPDLSEDDMSRLEGQIAAWYEGRGGEVVARAQAAEFGRLYLGLNAEGRLRFLRLLALHHGVDRARLTKEIALWDKAASEKEKATAEFRLRTVLVPRRIKLLSQFTDLPQGVKFLVDLRADLLRLDNTEPELSALAAEMRELFASWFDIGFLDLKRITWDSPALLLEKLVDYEAVHEIQSWRDLKNRLESDRRCFAFFHERMPTEPLIFVEVALVDGMAGSVQALLDENAPVQDVTTADTAIFYSISNCQKGLAGVSFGNFLIKRVVATLAADLPNLKYFATLSPIPGFRAWLAKELQGPDGAMLLTAEEVQELGAASGDHGDGPAVLLKLLERHDWPEDAAAVAALRAPLMRLCAHYLIEEKRGARALDRVAHFHLSNGAQVERLNWLGDTSPNGLRQSAGIMVNYRYRSDRIESNHEAYRGEGRVTAHPQVLRLLTP